MNQIIAALDRKEKPGIYQLTDEISDNELSQLCQDRDCKLFFLDGQTITNKQEFLQFCAKAMSFPDYFGKNWDAFEDCLTDLDWCTASQYLILYTDSEFLSKNDPESWKIVLDIFNSVVEYWADTETPMYIFLA